MDIAKCLIDKKTYGALEFSILPPNELSQKRKHLTCPKCQAPVFFRKASRNGQAAYFGSHFHLDGCPYSYSETNKTEDVTNEDTSQPIEINLHSETKSETDEVQIRTLQTTLPNNHATGESNKNSITHQTLSKLLTKLATSFEFRKSNQKIVVTGKEPTTVSNFFVEITNADQSYDENFHGYWGVLTDARLGGDNSLWLNTGGPESISFLISSDMVDAFYKRYKLEDEEDLAGAYAMVIGNVKTSANGKKYIIPPDASHVAIKRANTDTDLKNTFFLNEKKRIAFFIKNNEKGIFDEELGIKKKHYIDKKAAKEWMSKLANEYHPDKNLNDTSLDYDDIFACINKIYNRMTGKA